MEIANQLAFGLPHANWLPPAIILASAAAIVAAHTPMVPLQNLVLAIAIIACVSGSAGVVARAAHPAMLGSFNEVLWLFPALTLLQVLLCRAVARQLLQSWRAKENYGFWVLGVAATLMPVLLAACTTLSPHPPQLSWLTLQWIIGVVLMTLTTPTLINKALEVQPQVPGALLLWFGVQVTGLTKAFMIRNWCALVVLIAANLLLIASRLSHRSAFRLAPKGGQV